MKTMSMCIISLCFVLCRVYVIFILYIKNHLQHVQQPAKRARSWPMREDVTCVTSSLIGQDLA